MRVPIAAHAAPKGLSLVPGGRDAQVCDHGRRVHSKQADDAKQKPGSGNAKGRKGMKTARGKGAQADDGRRGAEDDREGISLLLLFLDPAHRKPNEGGRSNGGKCERHHQGVAFDPPGEGCHGPAGHGQIDNPGDNKGRDEK
jgi:hypothetical protein